METVNFHSKFLRKRWASNHLFVALFALFAVFLTSNMVLAGRTGGQQNPFSSRRNARSIFQKVGDEAGGDYRHDIVFPVIPSSPPQKLPAKIVSAFLKLSKLTVVFAGKVAMAIFVVKAYNHLQQRFWDADTVPEGALSNKALEDKLEEMQHLLESIFANKSIESCLEQQQLLWEEFKRLNETQTIELPTPAPAETFGNEDEIDLDAMDTDGSTRVVSLKEGVVRVQSDLETLKEEVLAVCAELQHRVDSFDAGERESLQEQIRSTKLKMEGELVAIKEQLHGMEDEFHSALQSHHELFQQRMREVKATLIKIVRDGAQLKSGGEASVQTAAPQSNKVAPSKSTKKEKTKNVKRR